VIIDNDVYNREAETWRDENHLLSLLVALTPPRIAYIRDVLTARLGIDPHDKQVLDVGCGGGLMAEEMAWMGCRVTGVDPSAPSLETARRHAAEAGLDIDYRHASGESLPFEDASFDIVYCCDVLEHVSDLDAVVREAARVLKPGGVYIFDTINRTLLSKIVLIKIAQEWTATQFFSGNFHVWEMFIKPEEMRRALSSHGLQPCEFMGLSMRGNPVTLLRLIRKVKRGRATYGDLGRVMAGGITVGGNLQVSYLGYAMKPV
jgi:2-polyprenyl-6-hydroxyphenyl methylase / 3-demethylubiquinone-9 3-methyltransferase